MDDPIYETTQTEGAVTFERKVSINRHERTISIRERIEVNGRLSHWSGVTLSRADWGLIVAEVEKSGV